MLKAAWAYGVRNELIPPDRAYLVAAQPPASPTRRSGSSTSTPLRHGWATMAEEEKVPELVGIDRLDRKSAKISRRYAKPQLSAKAAAAPAVSDAMFANSTKLGALGSWLPGFRVGAGAKRLPTPGLTLGGDELCVSESGSPGWRADESEPHLELFCE